MPRTSVPSTPPPPVAPFHGRWIVDRYFRLRYIIVHTYNTLAWGSRMGRTRAARAGNAKLDRGGEWEEGIDRIAITASECRGCSMESRRRWGFILRIYLPEYHPRPSRMSPLIPEGSMLRQAGRRCQRAAAGASLGGRGLSPSTSDSPKSAGNSHPRQDTTFRVECPGSTNVEQ